LVGFSCIKPSRLSDIAHERVRKSRFMGRAKRAPDALAARSAPHRSVGIGVKKSQRKFIVFSCLLGVLSLTSAALMALAPAPLAPGEVSSLFAIDAPSSLDVIFETKAPVTPQRWQYIYIHHSQSASGDAMVMSQTPAGFGDHFLIGNGDGAVDGEIQIGQLWSAQQAAHPPAGANKIDSHCISICLVGDFDRAVPTPTQMRRLAQLVGTLQGQLHISRDNVLMIDAVKSPAGAGKYFPAGAFKNQLLP
jgi:hypothetical protein